MQHDDIFHRVYRTPESVLHPISERIRRSRDACVNYSLYGRLWKELYSHIGDSVWRVYGSGIDTFIAGYFTELELEKTLLNK
jgi:hypothetical protein